jgi:hypothetical protein
MKFSCQEKQIVKKTARIKIDLPTHTFLWRSFQMSGKLTTPIYRTDMDRTGML